LKGWAIVKEDAAPTALKFYFGFGSTNMPRRRRWGRTPCQNHFALDVWGERGRLACGFGRRARTIVGQISLTGFRRDAENGNRDGRAPRPGATQ